MGQFSWLCKGCKRAIRIGGWVGPSPEEWASMPGELRRLLGRGRDVTTWMSEREVEDFERRLAVLLDTCASCGRALGMPHGERFGDCDADPAGGECACPQWCSQECRDRGSR